MTFNASTFMRGGAGARDTLLRRGVEDEVPPPCDTRLWLGVEDEVPPPFARALGAPPPFAPVAWG